MLPHIVKLPQGGPCFRGGAIPNSATIVPQLGITHPRADSSLETREESHLGLQPASEAAHVERGARGARHQLATIATTETRQERAKLSNEHG